MKTLPPNSKPTIRLPAFWRALLGVTAVTTILAGHFTTKGALYGNSLMGLAFGILSCLKDMFQPAGGGGYFLMMIFSLLVIMLMMLILASFILCLGGAVYVVACRNQDSLAAGFTGFAFGLLAFATFFGLVQIRQMPSDPSFHGEVDIEPLWFWWPGSFGVYALLYAVIALRQRKWCDRTTR